MDINKYLPKNLIESIYEDLSSKLDSKYHYHNLYHTKRVINSAREILMNFKLSEVDRKFLLTACLFHDYGFIKSHIDHEEIATKMIHNILPEYNFTIDEINIISSLILATKVDAIPCNDQEAIIRDADLEYLGSKDFERISEYLKREWLECGVINDSVSFYKIQYDFLSNHNFYTTYMKEKCGYQKEINLSYAKKMMESSH